MSVIRQLFRGETYCRVDQLVILQNMKRWPVCRFRFLLTPLPKRAEHGSRAAPQQTRFADPEQARSNHRVENALRHKVQTSAEQSQIEIRSVQNNFFSLQRSAQRRQIDIGEWIHNIIPARQADLEQTKLLSITMKAIGFGVDRHAID